jgi:hypothetical protein
VTVAQKGLACREPNRLGGPVNRLTLPIRYIYAPIGGRPDHGHIRLVKGIVVAGGNRVSCQFFFQLGGAVYSPGQHRIWIDRSLDLFRDNCRDDPRSRFRRALRLQSVHGQAYG